jgi:hypothetical protein
LILLYCLEILIQYNFLFLQALIMLFNIFVFVVSFRESEKELESSQLNIASVEKITH